MPEIVLTENSIEGWPGALRRDLPAWSFNRLIPNGELSKAPLRPLGAITTKIPDYSVPALRDLQYKYVDTGYAAVDVTNVLWSDSASWCTLLSLWVPGRAGLAHIVPGPSAITDVNEFLRSFPGTPKEIHMVTMPKHRDKEDGFCSVHESVRGYYGNHYDAITVFLITGHRGIKWKQRHQLGVDPRSGAFPVFN